MVGSGGAGKLALAHRLQLAAGNEQADLLDRVAVAARPPGFDVAVAVGVEVKAPGGAQHLATAEEDLEGFGGRHAGTQLAGGDGAGATPGVEIHPGRIGQIAALEHRRRQAY